MRIDTVLFNGYVKHLTRAGAADVGTLFEHVQLPLFIRWPRDHAASMAEKYATTNRHPYMGTKVERISSESTMPVRGDRMSKVIR